MDDLHSLLSRIRTETKPEIKASPKPLDVFREFLAHLDQIQRQARAAPERARPQPRRRPKRRPKAA